MARKFVKFDTGYRPNAPQSILDTTIDDLNLHDETKRKLRDAELITVGEIATYEMRHLYRIDKMGRGDVFAVLRALKGLGVDFKPSEHKKEIIESTTDKTDNANIHITGNKQNNRTNERDQRFIERNNNNSDSRQRNNDNREKQKTNDSANTHKLRERGDAENSGRRDREKNHNRERTPIDKDKLAPINVERQKVNTRDYDMYGNKRKNSDFDSNNKRNSQQNASSKPKPQPIKLPPLKNADGLYKFFKAGKWGYKNETGNVIIEPQFDEAYNFSEGLAAVERNEKVGFINTKGEVIIPYQYDTVCSFSEGLASVTLNDKCAYIDKEGNEIFGFDYEAATSFINDISLVKKDGKWGYMDRHTGEIRLR